MSVRVWGWCHVYHMEIWSKEKNPSQCPLRPVAVGRAGCEVTRARELALPLTNRSTRQSGPYTSTRQHSRAGGSGGSGGTCMGALTWKTWGGHERSKIGPPLLHTTYWASWASWGSTDELTLMLKIKETWWADQHNNHTDPEPELWVGPYHLVTHLWFAGACEGPGHEDQKLQDLYDTWQ